MNLKRIHHVRRTCLGFRVFLFIALVLGLNLLPAARAGTVLSFTNSAIITNFDSFNDSAPFPSTIQVPGLPGSLQSVTVTLYGLTNASSDGLQFLLVGPTNAGGSNVAVDLMDLAGNGLANNITITIADSGVPFPNGPIASGTYQPSGFAFPDDGQGFPQATTTNTLAGFIGTTAAGTWSLYGFDTDFTGTGYVNGGWSLTFNVVPAAPTVTTLAATGVSSTGATLNASVNPGGSPTAVYYEFGLTTNYNQFSATNTLSDVSDVQAVPLPVTLQAGTTYHFQAVAMNAQGTSLGGDLTFTTPSGVAVPPVIVASLTNGSQPVLALYGSAGSSYTIVSATNLTAPVTWKPFTNVTLSGPVQYFLPGPAFNPMAFFRAYTTGSTPTPPGITAFLTNGSHPVLALSGNVGTSYSVSFATNITPPISWTVFTNLMLTNPVQLINPPLYPMAFFRASQP